MGEQKEEIAVSQVHDNDKYVIKRTVTEEVSGEELLKIYADIDNGRQELQKQLDAIPKDSEARTAALGKNLQTLATRMQAFEPFAKKLKEAVPPAPVGEEPKYPSTEPAAEGK